MVGFVPRYAAAVALINAGRLDAGAKTLLDVFEQPMLDQFTLLSCYETIANVEAIRGRPDRAATWADRAESIAHPELETDITLAQLVRAHATCEADPAAAVQHALSAADKFAAGDMHIAEGRARHRAAIAYTRAGDRPRAPLASHVRRPPRRSPAAACADGERRAERPPTAPCSLNTWTAVAGACHRPRAGPLPRSSADVRTNHRFPTVAHGWCEVTPLACSKRSRPGDLWTAILGGIACRTAGP